MTAVTVKREIKDALKNKIVSKAEVADIVAATGKSVSTAEAKPIGDLYQLITGPRPMHALPGEDWPRFGKGAGEKLNAFFVKAKLPFGAGEDGVRARIEHVLTFVRMMPLAEAPKVDRLIPIWLPGPEGLMDGPTRTAHYDATNQKFYLHVRDSWRPDGVSQWFGPIGIKGVEVPAPEPVATEISADTLDRAARAYGDFAARALFDWEQCPQSMPMGARTVEKEFMAERRINGFRYSAVFSIGALAPGAALTDPNALDEVFIKRSGPGGDRILGPIDMTAVDGGLKATTLQRMRAALDAYEANGGAWTRSPPLMPAGQAITTTSLKQSPGGDMYGYSAMVPSGALTANGPSGDPNDAQTFVAVRSGGFAGWTEYSQPIAL